MLHGIIRAKYKNGIIQPLEDVDLPEGHEIFVEFKSASADAPKLSAAEKKQRIDELCGSSTLWGTSAEDVDGYLHAIRQTWE